MDFKVHMLCREKEIVTHTPHLYPLDLFFYRFQIANIHSNPTAVPVRLVLFRMRGIAHAYEPLSAGFEVSKIKQELAELGDHLNCDIELTDV